MLKTLIAFICLMNFAVAQDFSEVVEQYVKINQAKIEIVSQNRERIKGLEIIIADRTDQAASRFGHGLLRLVDDDNTWVNDPVISFSALSYKEHYSLRKSIFGGYSVLPQLMTFYEFWGMYTEKEERDLKRFVINLSAEDLDKFLDKLFFYLKNPDLLDDYTFLSNNCIGVITKIFVEAGLTKNKKIAKIPTSVHKWITSNDLSHYPELTMKNYSSLNKRIESFNLSEMSNQELQKNFSLSELNYLYFQSSELSESQVDFLASILKGHELNDVYSFIPVHYSLYENIQNEQKFLDQVTLRNTIVHRLTRNQLELVSHLKYQQKTLLRVDLNGAKNVKATLRKNKSGYFIRLNQQLGNFPLNIDSSEGIAVVQRNGFVEVLLILI